MTLRLALVSDIPKIMSLQQQAESAAQWTAREYERMLNEKSGVVLVAEMADKVCGFVAGAGIGAIAGGKKGAAIGAISGGVAGLIYDMKTRKNGDRW